MKKAIKQVSSENLDQMESGQMLLFVLIVVLILAIIVFAIITNVRVDVKETQMEREYEKGYSLAEEELLQISTDGFDTWDDAANVVQLDATDALYGQFCKGAETECTSSPPDGYGGSFTCFQRDELGDDGASGVIVKRCTVDGIGGMALQKDEVLEVKLASGSSGAMTLNWGGSAKGMSVMLVCKDSGGEYYNVRAAVCQTTPGADGTCTGLSSAKGFLSKEQAKGETPPAGHNTPLHIDGAGGCGGDEPVLIRIRALGQNSGDSASDITLLGGTNIPAQMEIVRSQGFATGTGEAEELSAPEVVTYTMINKRLPAIFDYVLFVADGGVTKQ